MLPRRIAVLVLSLVAAAACSDTRGDIASSTVRDSAGIRIVENAFPDSSRIEWWSIDAAPVVDIGGAGVDELYALHQVRDAQRFEDGRIVVANGSGSDVRFYSADGLHLVTSGRAGDGPGEFRAPMKLSLLPGDSVAVFDLRAGRVSILDPQGAFVRDMPVPTPDGSRARVVGTLGDGTFVGTVSSLPQGEPVQGMHQPDLTVLTWSMPDSTDAIATIPGPQRYINVRESGGRIQSIEILLPRYAPDAVVAVGGNAIVTGNQDVPQLVVYDVDGNILHLIRTGAVVEPVTQRHLEAWLEKRLEDIDPEDRAAVRQREADLPHGPTVPVFDDVLIDALGHVWVQDYDDRISPAGAWSVYDTTGHAVARIRLPADLVVSDIGSDYILGVEPDALGVQHVRMYRLMRG